MAKRQWLDEMGEISGFGGGYEAVCRAMVLAGIEWFDAHPDADPKFKGAKGVYGLILEDNDDAKALTAAIMNAPVYHDGQLLQERVGDDCTGAMHHAAIGHCLAYRRLGWEKYVERLKNRPED